jgi:L-arabinose isomerase
MAKWILSLFVISLSSSTIAFPFSFTEYYAMDYTDDVVLMRHDGPGHIKIAEGKIKVRPLTVYHGKDGKGCRLRWQ